MFTEFNKPGPAPREHSPNTRVLATTDPCRARLEIVARLIGGVAHDVNNMLGVIMAASETLAQGSVDDAEQQRLADTSLRAANVSADAVRRLMAVSESLLLAPSGLDCTDLFALLRPLAERAMRGELTLIVEPPASGLRCQADSAELESALLTLCFHIRDATREGGRLSVKATPVSIAPTSAPATLAAGDYVLFTLTGASAPSSGREVLRSLPRLIAVHEFAARAGGLLEVAYKARTTVARLHLPRAPFRVVWAEWS